MQLQVIKLGRDMDICLWVSEDGLTVGAGQGSISSGFVGLDIVPAAIDVLTCPVALGCSPRMHLRS